MMKRILSAVFTAVLLLGLIFSFPVAADAVSEMTVSDACVTTIKQMEGFLAIPRWDYGQWTVGFGSRCPDEHLERYQKEGIPMEEADALMREHLQIFEKAVNSYADRHGLSLNQGQFDALVCMSYNLGTALLYNTTNMINTAILGGASENELIYAFSVYCTAGGEFLPGLIRRRLVEANMYIHGEYDDYAPENYCYVLYDANGGTKDVIAQGFDCNLPAEPLSRPTREGYTFVGWYTAASGGTRVTALNESHDGVTLYARWQAGSTQGEIGELPEGGLQVTVQTDALNVRNGAGMEYSIVDGVFRGEQVTVTALANVDGRRWGYCEKGWIPLVYTNYGELTGDWDQVGDGEANVDQVQVPVRATVLSSGGVTVYRGPHTTYPKVKTLQEGTEIEITEVFTLFDTNWGKCEEGWVQLNLKLQLHDDQHLAHPFQAIVEYSYLNVRSGPGTQYSRTGTLQNGAKVQIVSLVYVGNVPWGRCSEGWISLDYTDFDPQMLAQYRDHSYGEWFISHTPGCEENGTQRRNCQYCDDYEEQTVAAVGHSFGGWYESDAGNCVTPGQERRDCIACDQFEVRETSLGDHGYGDWYETQPGTCIEPARERRDCAFCGAFESREGALGDHSYGDWYKIAAGSCAAPGQEQRDCVLCDACEVRDTVLGDHSYGQWYVTVAASCVDGGMERRDCTGCGSYEERATEPAGHNYGAWVTWLEATCSTEGQQRRTCQNCQAYESAVLPMTEHSFGLWYETVTPTADTAGEERRDCQHCDYYEVRVLEPTVHIFGAWYDEQLPTCVENGLQRRDCSHCYLTQTREIPALGHSFGNWETVTQPTCTEPGSRCRVCAVCGQEETETVQANGHSYDDEWLVLVKPTCTEGGKQARVCMICTALDTQNLEPLGHEMSQWSVVAEPTCTEPGAQVRGCIRCSQPERQQLPALGHSFSQWEIVTEAVCGQDGLQLRECTTCGEVERQTIAAMDHSFGDWQTVVEADCQTDGQSVRVCANCGYQESEMIPATGHTLGQWEIFENPQCEKEGQERRWCSVCDYFESRVIAALSHSYTDWSVRTAPSCESDGVEQRKCFLCGLVDTRPIAATGHSFGQWYVVKAPTTQEEGLERRDCSSCDAFESRELERLVETVTRVYATLIRNYANVRAGTGTDQDKVGVLFFGARVEVLEQKQAWGWNWGRIGDGQWVRLSDYFELVTVKEDVAVTRTYAKVTCDRLNIRKEPDAGAELMGYLLKDNQVEILEQKQVNQQTWGRVREGWICLTDNAEVFTQTTVKPAPTYESKVLGTVTKAVNIRAGAGTGYAKLGSLNVGTKVEVLEMALVNTIVWGRIDEKGWIRLDGYVDLLLEVIQGEQPHTHSYGAWYVAQEATCTTTGQQRRDCAECGEMELRTIAAMGHSFSQWFVISEGSCTAPREEGRVCSRCGETETRTDSAAGHVFGDWTVQTAPTCTNAGVELRVCSLCDAMESRELAALGHSFGLWTLVKAPTTQEEGLERRECANCKAYEERKVDKLTETITTVTKLYAKVIAGVNIRSGAGIDYDKLGSMSVGTVVELLEVKTVDGQVWGRYQQGWIRMDGFVSLATAREEANADTHLTIYATVTATVNIRAGAGTGYTKLGSMRVGQQVQVVEIVTNGTQSWGRCDQGWIRLDSFTTLTASSPASNAYVPPAGAFDDCVEDSWFDDVLFIGDSRIVGLQMFARSGEATYFCDVGMSLYNYRNKVLSDDSYSDLSLVELLTSRSFKKVIINFGLNEAGYATSALITKYSQLLDLVKGTQTDAVIIINGVMSVSEKKAAQADCFTPEHLAEISQAFAALADGEKIFYIDCNPYFTDADGYLLSQYTDDGYHPNVSGYRRWRDWMAFAVKQLNLA